MATLREPICPGCGGRLNVPLFSTYRVGIDRFTGTALTLQMVDDLEGGFLMVVVAIKLGPGLAKD